MASKYPECADPSSLGEGTDYWDEVTRKNVLIHQENVSVSRGTEKLKCFLSVGHFNQEGIIKGSGFRNTTFRSNSEIKIAKWLSMGNKLGFARSITDGTNETDEWNSTLINVLGYPRPARHGIVRGTSLVPSIII